MPATRSSKPPRPPSRSRFQEGSMNDRASAAPPVHFIGPDSIIDVNPPNALRVQPSARNLRTKPSVGLRASGTKPSIVSSVRPVAAQDAVEVEERRDSKETAGKKESKEVDAKKQTKRGSKQLLGQVWNDITQKFRSKKEAPPPTPSSNSEAKKSTSADERPSKEEVYANYHHLVASGFFSSHAIQSTRQPAPPGVAQRPSTSQANGPPPAWPLPQLPLTPNQSRTGSPVKSPASASSRGTKRANEEEDDERELSGRKVRKMASTPRDLAIPKRRSSSRLAAAAAAAAGGKRSISMSRNTSSTYQQQGGTGQSREPNKLTKRVLNRLPTPAHVSVPDRGSSTAGRRNVSDMVPPAAAIGGERTLRPRRSAADVTNAHANGTGGLKVRPDANRGIPVVPDIPSKFTYGEDRENHGPWRGLRRGFGQ